MKDFLIHHSFFSFSLIYKTMKHNTSKTTLPSDLYFFSFICLHKHKPFSFIIMSCIKLHIYFTDFVFLPNSSFVSILKLKLKMKWNITWMSMNHEAYSYCYCGKMKWKIELWWNISESLIISGLLCVCVCVCVWCLSTSPLSITDRITNKV